MPNQQYLDLLHALKKETIAKMIKAAICQQFPEPLATQYCQQFDDFKKIVDILEVRVKQNKK